MSEDLIEKIKKNSKKAENYDEWTDRMKKPSDKKSIREQVKIKVKDELAESLFAVLNNDSGVLDYINSIVESTDARLDGKTTKQRIQFALASYMMQNEEVLNEISSETRKSYLNKAIPDLKNQRKKLDVVRSIKTDNADVADAAGSLKKDIKRKIRNRTDGILNATRTEEVIVEEETHTHDVHMHFYNDEKKNWDKHHIKVTTKASNEPVFVKKAVVTALKNHPVLGPKLADHKKEMGHFPEISINADEASRKKNTHYGTSVNHIHHDPIKHGLNEASKAELAAMAAAAMNSGVAVKKVEAGTTAGLSYKDWKKAATTGEKITGKGVVKADARSLAPSATFKGTRAGKKFVREEEELLEATLNSVANKVHDALGSHVGSFNHARPTGQAYRGHASGPNKGYVRDSTHTFTPNKKMSDDDFSKHVDNVKKALNIKGEGKSVKSKYGSSDAPASLIAHHVPGTDHAIVINHKIKHITVGTKSSLKEENLIEKVENLIEKVKKAAEDGADEASNAFNPMVQLKFGHNKKKNTLKFADGEVHSVSPNHIQKALDVLSYLKPAERETKMNSMFKSKNHFMKHIGEE